MISSKLKGMGVALITPFKDDESIDFEALARVIEHQIKNGTDYLVVCGTTAETPTLTEQEKDQIREFVLQVNNGRIPVVLGVGGNNTRSVVE
ncbi:MAG: dihydrodipicolinate synthase family protein, partial [Bacteroidales bacterium]|nr:dihydrodipicolinate synthase family protein [Bacteroidales bacterium]